MREDCLQNTWKRKYIKPADLRTTTGKSVVVIDSGEHNHNEGPDFLNARLMLGNTHWAGNVEVHKKSSDWELHGHHYDARYNNVILHVVMEPDREVYNALGRKLECMVLKPPFYPQNEGISAMGGIATQLLPCGKLFSDFPLEKREKWLEHLFFIRLKRKANVVATQFAACNSNFDEMFFRSLSGAFGFNINSESFSLLGQHLPFNLLVRNPDNFLRREALIFGQAGLLSNSPKDAYQAALKEEYYYLKNLYNLKEVPPLHWKSMRTHSGNFPEVRLAEFASLIPYLPDIIAKAMHLEDISDIIPAFKVPASGYWDRHCRFGVQGRNAVKTPGTQSVYNLLINSVLPILYFAGGLYGKSNLEKDAARWYFDLPPENNRITRIFKVYGFSASHAAQSQALIELYKNYCKPIQCAHCAIGKEHL